MKKPIIITKNRSKKMNSESPNLLKAKERVRNAVGWLREQNTNTRILIKQTKNLGDTLHITPIARHYKTVYPDCKIAFVVGHYYMNVHEHNKDFDMLMPISSGLTGQERISLGAYMMSMKGVNKLLCPSIHPFGEVWKSHVWSYPVISHQYFHNAEIRPPGSIQGGGKLHAPITQADRDFSKNFVNGQKCIALEYHSYSHPVGWRVDKFKKFVDLAKKDGYQCISFAGKNEGIIPGTVDARGMSWRHTIGVLSYCKYIVGVGSGITMLSCCANPAPRLIEIGVSESILMKNCGYSEDSVSFNSAADPSAVLEWMRENK